MIELLVGENKTRVDCKDISNVSIKYTLKDIKNYGKRNISYSKPITVYRTKESESIFKNLYNINVTNGYDIKNYISAELVENGIITFKGVLRVTNSTANTYEVVLTSSQFNLFDDMGSSLITGNGDASLNISFDDDYYPFVYNRDNIRNAFTSDPSDYGKGYQLAVVDYDNTVDNIDDLLYDYPIMPNIAAKEIFDAIFEKYGYTYTLSEDISTYLSHLYIPFNKDLDEFIDNWEAITLLLGSTDTLCTIGGNQTIPGTGDLYPTGRYEIYRNGLDDLNTTNKTFMTIDGITYPVYEALQGTTLIQDKIKDKDSIFDSEFGYVIPKSGNYTVDLSLLFGKAFIWIDYTSTWFCLQPTETQINLQILRDGFIADTIEIDSIEPSIGYDGAYNYDDYVELYTTSFNVDLQANDRIVLQTMSLEEDIRPMTRRSGIMYDTSSNMVLTLNNVIIPDENTVTMNDMLPKDYSQADFVNDIFKMFNVYLEIDEDNPKDLTILSYPNYFDNSDLIDWTDKIDNESLEAESIKNNFGRKTVFTYSSDTDIYNEDFTNKYEYPFGYKVVNNDSNISYKTNKISLKSSPTIIKNIDFTY